MVIEPTDLFIVMRADGSSKTSQTAYDLAYFMNGKYQRQEAAQKSYL